MPFCVYEAVLLADRWTPKSGGDGLPTALIRVPYGRTCLVAAQTARPLAERGFQGLVQSTRGTFGSDGPFDLMRVACLVRPLTEHLAALGTPTWYARFTAQVRGPLPVWTAAPHPQRRRTGSRSAYQAKRRRLRPVNRWATFAPCCSSRVTRVEPRRASILALIFLAPAITNGTATAATAHRAIIFGSIVRLP
jgi:hypothetical protein